MLAREVSLFFGPEGVNLYVKLEAAKPLFISWQINGAFNQNLQYLLDEVRVSFSVLQLTISSSYNTCGTFQSPLCKSLHEDMVSMVLLTLLSNVLLECANLGSR